MVDNRAQAGTSDRKDIVTLCGNSTTATGGRPHTGSSVEDLQGAQRQAKPGNQTEQEPWVDVFTIHRARKVGSSRMRNTKVEFEQTLPSHRGGALALQV